jgi:hypothetical protein
MNQVQMNKGIVSTESTKFPLLPFAILLLLCPLLFAADSRRVCDVAVHDSARDLQARDGWLRDSRDRYVLLRGVNFGPHAKFPPYLPVMPGQNDEARPQLARLRCLGMNVVRLLIMWKALEPFPNPNLDELSPGAIAYLGRVTDNINELYSEGLFVILDFHQDIAQESYTGDGFPDWAVGVDDRHRRLPIPYRFDNPRWGTNYYDLPWFDRLLCWCAGFRRCANYNSGVRNTLWSFWMDDLYNEDQTETERELYKAQNPQTHLIKTIGQVARYFAAMNNGAGHPAILGYEPFNEPAEVSPDKRRFEKNILPEFYRKVATEISKFDSKALVFIEPRVDWTIYSADGPEYQGLKFTSDPISFLPKPFILPSTNSGVFSFHYYDFAMLSGIPFEKNMRKKAKEWPDIFRQMREQADETKLVPFLTEFGCSQDWKRSVVRACMDLQFRQVEAQRLNATYWNYDLYNTQKGKDNWNKENFSLLGPDRSPRNLDIVARPYPVRASAMPQLVFFDLRSKNAAFILTGQVVDAPTVIFVPLSCHYPDGFEIRATTSESTITWNESEQMLYWYPDKSVAPDGSNKLIISPIDGVKSSALPDQVQDLTLQKPVMVVRNDKKIANPCAANAVADATLPAN